MYFPCLRTERFAWNENVLLTIALARRGHLNYLIESRWYRGSALMPNQEWLAIKGPIRVDITCTRETVNLIKVL